MESGNESPTTTRSAGGFFQRIFNFLFSPHPSIIDIAGRRKARLSITLSAVLLAAAGLSLFFIGRGEANITFYIQVALTIVSLFAYILSRLPRFTWGSALMVSGLSISGFANLLAGSDDPTSALYATVPLALAIGTALLPVWGNVVHWVASITAILTIPLFYTPFNYGLAGNSVSQIFVIGLLLIVVQNFRDNLERERLSEVQAINDQLRDFSTTLEQRVADRTRALETTTLVSRRLASVLDPRQLVVEVVEQVQQAFNYYHVHIYLKDTTTRDLVLSGGTGEAGAQMLASGHRISQGRGLVGRADETRTPVLVPDVAQAIGWLPNPLLPETKAEAAVPIIAGSEVLGVLDVQHNLVNGLTQVDITLLEAIAGQVAISLQNARSYEESRNRADLEGFVNVIGQKIQQTTSIEETLQTAIRELGAAIGAKRVKASIQPASGPASNEVALAEEQSENAQKYQPL